MLTDARTLERQLTTERLVSGQHYYTMYLFVLDITAFLGYFGGEQLLWSTHDRERLSSAGTDDTADLHLGLRYSLSAR